MLISERLKKKNDQKRFQLYPDYSIEESTMNIEICSKCNQSCIYCIYDAMGIHKEGKYINEDFFYRVTKEAFELGVRSIGLYSAGEPLLNTNIYNYVKYLKKIGFEYVYISTNGMLCTPKNFLKLAEAGIDSIKFTISSCNRDNYIRHHGVDCLEQVISNIKFASKYRKKHNLRLSLFIFMIVTKFNEHEKAEIREMFGQDVDEVLFTNVVDGVFSMKGLKEYLYVAQSEYFLTGDRISLPCNELFNRINVDIDGYLCVCCLINDDYTKIEDLNKCSLKTALYGENIVNLRKRHMAGEVDHIICNRCIYNIKEEIYPLSDNIGVKPAYIDDLDRMSEIKRRFQID